ncbi:MAG: lanthionine synthetase LanC family protein, partial [Chloroflexota bacterium]
YMSPRQAEGQSPAVTDDVYALGALLFLLATGADPSLAPRPDRLLDRPLSLLNPAAPAALEPLIARCLAPDPSDRYQSMIALDAALGAMCLAAPATPTFSEEAWKDRPWRAGDLARRLGDTLRAVSVMAPEGKGRTWLSTHQFGAGVHSRDINTGAAGSLLALAEIAGISGEARHREVVAEGARWLQAAPRLSEQPLPGLYIGEAGVGAALLRAGQVLGDPELIGMAEARGRWIAGLPYGVPFASPDLFNGAAGRLRFHLLLWDETAAAEHLAAARSAGDALLDAAEWIGDGGDACRWPFPDGYDGLSGHAYLGYAHGAAGIADALLDLYEATRQERFRAAAVAAARWLLGLARPALSDGTGLDWPGVENGPAGRLWCHGASGIALLFLHLAQVDALPGAWEVARRAARTTGMGARAISPVQCHGLAGQIETLLDVAAAGDQRSGEDAARLGMLLEAFAVERDGLMMFSSESPTIFTPDYMVGYAGVAVCLLRLSDPGRPRQLSRAGFRYRPA